MSRALTPGLKPKGRSVKLAWRKLCVKICAAAKPSNGGVIQANMALIKQMRIADDG